MYTDHIHTHTQTYPPPAALVLLPFWRGPKAKPIQSRPRADRSHIQHAHVYTATQRYRGGLPPPAAFGAFDARCRFEIHSKKAIGGGGGGGSETFAESQWENTFLLSFNQRIIYTYIDPRARAKSAVSYRSFEITTSTTTSIIFLFFFLAKLSKRHVYTRVSPVYIWQRRTRARTICTHERQRRTARPSLRTWTRDCAARLAF